MQNAFLFPYLKIYEFRLLLLFYVLHQSSENIKLIRFDILTSSKIYKTHINNQFLMLLVDKLNQDSTILKKLRYCPLQLNLKSKFCQNCFSSSYYPLNSIKILYFNK